MTLERTFAALAVAALISVAGCRREAPKEPERSPVDTSETQPVAEKPAAENPHWATDICARVPLEKVVAAVGGTEPKGTEPSTSAPASCRYLFRLDGRQAAATVQMLSGYELERTAAGARARDVSGLGDEAWAHERSDGPTLYVRRGALVFTVDVAGADNDKQRVAGKQIAELVLASL